MGVKEFGCMDRRRIAYVDAYSTKLQLPLSSERLRSYQLEGDAPLDTVVRYFWNIALCEALYPTLNAAEIALRNSIHASMTSYFGTEDWFDDPNALEPDQYATVQAAKRDLRGRGKPHNAGRVIAQLHFGFWVTMLSKPYEQRVWERNGFTPLRTVFPHAKRRERRRWLLYRRFADINALRNRVFHYEPVWDEVVIAQRTLNVADLHQGTLDAIGWISPALRDSVGFLDRFEAVHSDGHTQLESNIRRYLGV